MAIATPWIGIDFVNQFFHGMGAIAHHQRWFAPGSSNQFVAHDQQAVVATWQEFFDQDFAIASRCFISLIEQVAFIDVDGDAFSLIAILGFDHHGQSNVLRNLPGVF